MRGFWHLRVAALVATLAMLLAMGMVGAVTMESWAPVAVGEASSLAVVMPEIAETIPGAAEGAIIGLGLVLPAVVVISRREQVQERFRQFGRSIERLTSPRLLVFDYAGLGCLRGNETSQPTTSGSGLDELIGWPKLDHTGRNLIDMGELKTELARGTTTDPMTALHGQEARLTDFS